MNLPTFCKRLSCSLFAGKRISKNSETLHVSFGINRLAFRRLIYNVLLGLLLVFNDQENLLLSMIFFMVYSIDLLQLIFVGGSWVCFIIPVPVSTLICNIIGINFPDSIYIFWTVDMIQLLLIIMVVFLFIRERWIFDKRSGYLSINWYKFYERKRETYCCELGRIVDSSIFESKVDIEDEPETFWGAVILLKVLTKSSSLNKIESPNPSFYPCILRPYIFLSMEEAQRIKRKICNFLKLQ